MKRYIRVTWSDNVQEFMDYPWFKDECVLDIDTSSDYLIPEHRYYEVTGEENKTISLLTAAADWIATIKDEEGGVNFDDTLEHEIAAHIKELTEQ